ncbi:MAG: hypothetical protein ACREBF_03485 [Candidatus Micrarchaeales archaeon]
MPYHFIGYSKNELEEMLKASEDDFKSYERNKNVSKLRDAVNKLYAIAQNITSNKIKHGIENYGEFRSNFLKEFKDHDLISSLGILHRFFYTGLGYEQSVKDIEYEYHEAKKKIKTMIKKNSAYKLKKAVYA